MIRIKEAIIVEGKYDKIKLSSLVDTVIIETNGFRIFRDKEKLNLIKNIAEKRGILILTDSDGAGMMIRNYLKGAVPPERIINAYIPEIIGKEKRKERPSKEGTLGVEGIDKQVLLSAIKRSGITVIDEEPAEKPAEITKNHLYELGLTGGKNSSMQRKKLLVSLGLPEYLSTNAMLSALNSIYTLDEFKNVIKWRNDIDK